MSTLHVTLPDGVGVDISEYDREPELTETLADLAGAYALRSRPTTLAMVAEVLLARAKARLGDDPEGAAEDLSAALDVAAHVGEPDLTAELYGVRAQALAVLDGDRRALVDYDLAVELAPSNPSYRNNRSVSRRKLGDLSGAVADARRAVGEKADSWLYWLTLGEALATRGDAETAAVVRHAHRINPTIGRYLADPVFDTVRDCPEFPRSSPDTEERPS